MVLVVESGTRRTTVGFWVMNIGDVVMRSGSQVEVKILRVLLVVETINAAEDVGVIDI